MIRFIYYSMSGAHRFIYGFRLFPLFVPSSTDVLIVEAWTWRFGSVSNYLVFVFSFYVLPYRRCLSAGKCEGFSRRGLAVLMLMPCFGHRYELHVLNQFLYVFLTRLDWGHRNGVFSNLLS